MTKTTFYGAGFPYKRMKDKEMPGKLIVLEGTIRGFALTPLAPEEAQPRYEIVSRAPRSLAASPDGQRAVPLPGAPGMDISKSG